MSTDKTERRSEDPKPYHGPERRLLARRELEAWGMLVLRLTAATLGLVIVGVTILLSNREGLRFYIVLGIGLGFTWPVVGVGLQQAFALLRGQREHP